MTFARIGFRARSVYRVRKQSVFRQAGHQFSMLVAFFVVVSFVLGNVVAEKGVYAFFRTAIGKSDDSLIVFTGTVSPVEKVPDYARWAKYGGDSSVHTYQEVPMDLLLPVPAYSTQEMSQLRSARIDDLSLAQRIFTTPYEGDYATQREGFGSHPGVDIDVPLGTPVVSIANGIVDKVSMQNNGYGRYVMIRHPNVPDPARPGSFTTYYSTYAHLDQAVVSPGQIVAKGQQIGTSGNTGFVMGNGGYHLYFQIDNDTAPWHPYWPFTSDEATAAGLSFVSAINSGFHRERIAQYTVSPMLFVQRYSQFSNTMVAAGQLLQSVTRVDSSSSAPRLTPAQAFALRQKQRIEARIAAAAARKVMDVAVNRYIAIATPDDVLLSQTQNMSPSVSTSPVEAPSPSVRQASTVDHLEFRVADTFSRTWNQGNIVAVDRNGDTVADPFFTGNTYIISSFNPSVDIVPNIITPAMWVAGQGKISFRFLALAPNTKKTIILHTKGSFETQSNPIKFER